MRWVAATVAALACATTSVARAETDDTAARAEALFEEGKVQRGAGRYPQACADFEESRRLEEGIGVTLYLADCYEHAGDFGRAVSEFRRAETLAVARGDERASVARRRAEAIEHDRPAPNPAAREQPPPPPPVAAPSVMRDAPASTSHATRRWLGVGMAGAGVVGIGVGTVFGITALSKLSESNAGPCRTDNRCSSTGLALRQQSESAAAGSTIGFIAGATLLAAGLTVYLTTPGDREITVTPTVATSGAGAILEGRF